MPGDGLIQAIELAQQGNVSCQCQLYGYTDPARVPPGRRFEGAMELYRLESRVGELFLSPGQASAAADAVAIPRRTPDLSWEAALPGAVTTQSHVAVDVPSPDCATIGALTVDGGNA